MPVGVGTCEFRPTAAMRPCASTRTAPSSIDGAATGCTMLALIRSISLKLHDTRTVAQLHRRRSGSQPHAARGQGEFPGLLSLQLEATCSFAVCATSLATPGLQRATEKS